MIASLLQTEQVLCLAQGEKKVRGPLSKLHLCCYCNELGWLERVSHEHEVDFHHCFSCLLECEGEDPDNTNSTAKVVVPPKELMLAGKDAAAEYDELADPQDFQDDSDIIALRKTNEVGIFIKVTPQHEEGEVTVCFKMKHDFKNLLAPICPIKESDQDPGVI
ncbi:Dynactin subunit 4 [Heterocephalus glaber]|uniref:Dynactin subunit 4 n=1 Tax=Heterocephalus glaber TaxID=10181 RepID=G5C7F2_HETGA|nr:Dynactin subunit 4 [Heterocephalus glaber]